MSKTTTGTAIRVGIATLRANPLRTILSTLGVVIGVASLVAVLAVGDGMEQYGRDSIEDEGIQTIVVDVSEGDRIDGVFVPRAPTVHLGSDDALDLTGALPPGNEVSLRVMGTGLVTPDAEVATPRGVVVRGVLPPAKGIKGVTVAHGRMFTRDEARVGERVAVISPRLADSLAAPRAGSTMVGRTIRFADTVTFTVLGVLGEDERTRRVNAAVVPFTAFAAATAPRLVAGALPGAAMDVTAPDPGQVAATKRAIEQWAAKRLGDKAKELRIQSAASEERIEQMRRGVLAFKLFMGAIVGISLIVGGIGIMNVMLASVTERTREIGIRKTTGARRRDILEQFLAESVVITSAGAALGVLLGLGGAFGITAIIRSFAKVPIHAAFTVGTLVIAIGVSVLVGLVFGTYPARRAAGLSPIDAIRHE